MSSRDFLGGVVEGFYGQPWTPAQRLCLFDQMAGWGLNTYAYAPKDDLKHRALWREEYDAAEAASLKELIRACRDRGLRFIYALSPGLDIRFAETAETDRIGARFTQLLELGCEDFALLFDDLPGPLREEDRERFGTPAAAQSTVTNAVRAWVRNRRPGGRFLFCPTAYCDRMVRWGLGGPRYLEELGQTLHPDIDVLWTGPEIVSETIPVESIRALTGKIRRPPVIWDNLHANDYDLRRLYCGPYAGRPLELRGAVRGILSNPNNEFPINYVPLRTLGAYLQTQDSWDPRTEFLSAVREWHAAYSTVGAALPLADLILLADCHYLPYQEGPEAEAMLSLVRRLTVAIPAPGPEALASFLGLNRRVQATFERLTELRDREMFYAWSRRAWELKEELQLLTSWLEARSKAPGDSPGIACDTHRPGTYRGGTVARLQHLLVMNAEGEFQATPQDIPASERQ